MLLGWMRLDWICVAETATYLSWLLVPAHAERASEARQGRDLGSPVAEHRDAGGRPGRHALHGPRLPAGDGS